MSEQIIQELQTKIQELEAAKTKEAEDKEKVVAELIEIRKKKAEAEEALRLKNEQPAPVNETPEQIIQREFQKRESESRKLAQLQAEEEFKRLHNEFSPETDTTGLAYEAFKKELSKFNFDGLNSKEDFITRLSDVYRFMNPSKTEVPENFYSGGRRPNNSAPVDDGSKLSPKEDQIIKQLGWTKEKFLKQKASHPHFIQSLMNR